MNQDLRSFGPRLGSQQITKYLNGALLTHMRNCASYVYSLSAFDQFCVFRYTLGSGSVNSKLIFGQVGESAAYWAYIFFTTFLASSQASRFSIPLSWSRLGKYLYDPPSFLELDTERQLQIATYVIDLYIGRLAKIINNCPPVPSPGFHTFKVSSRYPGVPDFAEATRPGFSALVPQIPFNSTSVNPNMNYAMFLADDATCCLWDIFVPAGNRVLYVPEGLHAYGDLEKEIIFPPGCAFDVTGAHISQLSIINKNTMRMNQLQQRPFKMGPIYALDETEPCNTGACRPTVINIETYDCDYVAS